jgi:hypothetical protein
MNLSSVIFCVPAMQAFIPFVSYVFQEVDSLAIEGNSFSRETFDEYDLATQRVILDHLLLSHHADLPSLFAEFEATLHSLATVDEGANQFSQRLNALFNDANPLTLNAWKIPFVLSLISGNPAHRFKPEDWLHLLRRNPS